MSGLQSPFDFPLGGGGETADDYARMLAGLFPPGKLWRLIPGASFLYDVLQGVSDELARLDDRVGDMLNEIDPSTATELLPEHERQLDLVAAATTAERRANIVARLVARQRFRPVDFQTVLATLLALPAASVVIIERTRAQVIAMGDDRELRHFFIYRNPSLPGTYFLASAQVLVTKIKPSHTIGTVIESVTFTCGDPHSICGRDILGA